MKTAERIRLDEAREEKVLRKRHWRDHVLFHEYFHGDNGAGLGASHQTGRTGLVAKRIELDGLLDPKAHLAGGERSAFIQSADSRAAPGVRRGAESR